MSLPRASSPGIRGYGAFSASRALRNHPSHPFALPNLSLQDREEIRLLLAGESVIDWHRLHMHNENDVRRLLALNSFNIDDDNDYARLETLRTRAVRYIVENLSLRVDESVASKARVIDLPLLAAGDGWEQRQACMLLKVMHIMYHIDARELLTELPIANNDLFGLVERSVVTMFDELRLLGVPVTEFAWSRKSHDSLVTKLLVKRETIAAQVFDRLRFRLIVASKEDVLPTLHVMLHRCIPFNYVVPGHTVNSLIPLQTLEAQQENLAPGASSAMQEEDMGGPINAFSGESYRVLNFVADLPVRVDELLPDVLRERLHDRGRVVFVLVEFQIMDQSTAQINEDGENSHVQYKRRQLIRVRERLLREPKSG